MPPVEMKRAEFGLYLGGTKQSAPAGTLRRARGIRNVTHPTIMSRQGSLAVMSGLSGLHSLFRYKGARYAGAGTRLYHEGVSIRSGLDGNRLSFVAMPPTVGVEDYAFVAGGGDLFKVHPDGTTTSQWGINAPTGALTATEGAAGSMAAGTYRYSVTFLNSTSGHRSNALSVVGDASVTIAGSKQVALTNIPISSDPQVDKREIWRTLGNQATLFLLATLDNNTATTYTDDTVDANLGTEELPDDNDPPEDDYDDAWGPWESRMWWSRDAREGKRGRIYFSPVGRPEAVEDFLDVTTDDDPVQRGVIWGGFNWIFSEKRVTQILGSGPFTFRDISGVPGTVEPHSVAPTLFGIVYRALDGIRIFDGSSSRILNEEAVGRIFACDEDVENLVAFTTPTVAVGAWHDEYLISDGVQTLACHLPTRTWRDLGVGVAAFFSEDDTGEVMAAVGTAVWLLESHQLGELDDAGSPIAFEVEWPGYEVDLAQPGVIQRVAVKIDTGGQAITPTFVYSVRATEDSDDLVDAEVALATIVTDRARTVELAVGRSANVFSLRLSGMLTAAVEAESPRFDVYIPAADTTTEKIRRAQRVPAGEAKQSR